MGTFEGFLMRDSLRDAGVVPSPGYPYYSPDLIACPQVAKPAEFFAGNWASDPNQPVEMGSRLNPVYVRAKNLSSAALSGYYISVFRANTSLFLTPSVWRDHPLLTTSGQTYVALPTPVQPNTVAVGQDFFMLDATASNLFCLVGIVSPSPNPTLPSNFSSYSAYIEWARNTQNACGRNLNRLRNYPNRTLERLDGFENPSSSEAAPTLFEVAVKGGTLPAGSNFGLQCTPLGVNTSWNISAGPVQTASGMTPTSFKGTVTTWATLPAGARWPAGVSLDTVVYVGEKRDGPVAAFATPFEDLGVKPEEVEGLPEGGVLVRLGNVETMFVSQ